MDLNENRLTNTKIVSYSSIACNEINIESIYDRCLNKESSVAVSTGLSEISEEIMSCLKEDAPALFRKSRSSLLSFSTLNQSLKKTGWTAADLSDCGLIFATTTGQIDLWQSALPLSKIENENQDRIIQAAHRQSLGYSLIELQKHFQINGPCTLVSSSCSASLQALAIASLWIRQGKVKRCVVGSTEILSNLTVQGFHCLRLLSKDIAKPFNKDRSGINLGEASVFFCLEADNVSELSAHGWISGVGFSTDAYHPTAPHPEGKGSAIAIQRALADARLEPIDINWIHAHGTGSLANDLAEASAIKTCFPGMNIPVTSTKPIHGHTLGASGTLEAALILESFKKQTLLPTMHANNIDPKITLNIFDQPKHENLNHVLKNSLGFGGINASIIFSKNQVDL